jgi:perosamine synthetase
MSAHTPAGPSQPGKGGAEAVPGTTGSADREELRSDFLAFHKPTLGPEEEVAVLDVLRSGWLTTGSRAKAFEREFAAHTGVPHAVAVSSCTAALHLALKLLELGPGDEVLLPTTTFAATANVVVHAGARPVFCDIDPITLTIDPADAQARVTKHTRAIIPVHLGGYPCAMPEILDLAARHRLEIIEDAAHAIETEMGGKKAGAHGTFGAFSFYPTKSITTGEGGMLVTARDDLAERARVLALHGLSQDAWRRYTRDGSPHYDVVEPGYKYNLPDLAAALGLVQLRRLEVFYNARRRLALAYAEALAGLPVTWQPLEVAGGRAAHHLFILLLDAERRFDRNALARALLERQVGTSIHFRPLHLMPFYAQTFGYRQGDLPRAESVYERCLSLPIYPAMTIDDVAYVAAQLQSIMSGRAGSR